MRRILFPFAVFAAVTTIVPVSRAQSNEVGGIVGRTFISDQGVLGTGNIHFGHGLTVEANYGRRLLNIGIVGLSAELPVVINTDEELHFSGLSEAKSFTSYFFAPSARLSLLPSGAFSPWISFGGGVGHFSASSRLESGQSNPSSKGTTTGVVQLGLGLDIRVIHSVYLRGEVREFSAGEPQLNVSTGKSRYYNLFPGGGLVVRF
jgi:hypothetical protein